MMAWCVQVIGVREGGSADLVVISGSCNPYVLPRGYPWQPEEARGWDWGAVNSKTTATARAVLQIVFADHNPPDSVVVAVCLGLYAMPREGFEVSSTEVFWWIVRELGAEFAVRYSCNRWAIDACGRRG